MMESAPSFAEAEQTFRAFLRSQGWPTNLLWLSRDRVLGRRLRNWVFRPEELTSTDESHRFYDAVRQAGSGVGLRAKWRLGGRSLVYVEESGSGGGLYCSVATDVERWPIRRVKSRLVWVGVRAYVRFLGQSPFLASTKLTGSNRSDRPVAGA